jgi:hypothetical protein
MPLRPHSPRASQATAVVCLALAGALGAPADASAAVTLGADLSTTPNFTTACGGMLPGCNVSPIQSAGVNQAAPFDGVVVRWRVKTFSGPIKLRLIRPFGGTNYLFVSSGPVENGTGTGIDTFPARLPIKVGDHVGVELTSPTSKASLDSGGTRPGDRTAVWASINPDGSSSHATIAEGARTYMNADVEADADRDGFGDETQDQCPTDPTTQGACPAGGGETPGGTGPSPLAFGSETLVTLRLTANRIPATGPLKLRVANANGFAVTGTLTGRTTKPVSVARKRRVKLRAKSFEVPARESKTISLRLPKPLRRLLARNGKLSLRLTATVRDPAGNPRTVTKKVAPRLKGKRRAQVAGR